MAAGIIRVINGAKHVGGRGGQWVFRDLDLEVAPGEMYCLLGPSGSGKSTLLRILAGLDTLTSGQLEIRGTPIVDPRALRSSEHARSGLVFQEPLLLPWLDVGENIALGLRYRRNRRVLSAGTSYRRQVDIDGVTEIASRLGIADLLSRYPSQLSGGQAQRVALARTVITQPHFLLLDEPFAALDPGTRSSLQEWLAEMVTSLGLTTVFVTHDIDEAVRLGGRIGVLAGAGRGLSQTWDVTEVLDAGQHSGSLRAELVDHVSSLSCL